MRIKTRESTHNIEKCFNDNKCLKLGNIEKKWSGKRDSNPRPLPWQGSALPLSYSREKITDICKESRNLPLFLTDVNMNKSISQ